MKDKLIMLLQIFVVLAVIYIATACCLIEYNSTKPIFTDNMKDCQEKGGEYVLRIKPDGKVWLERCKISKEFDYHNK